MKLDQQIWMPFVFLSSLIAFACSVGACGGSQPTIRIQEFNVCLTHDDYPADFKRDKSHGLCYRRSFQEYIPIDCKIVDLCVNEANSDLPHKKNNK